MLPRVSIVVALVIARVLVVELAFPTVVFLVETHARVLAVTHAITAVRVAATVVNRNWQSGVMQLTHSAS